MIHCSFTAPSETWVDIMQSATSKFSNSANCHTVKPQLGPIIIFIPNKYSIYIHLTDSMLTRI